MWECTCTVQDNDGRTIKLDKAECTDTGPLSREILDSVVQLEGQKGSTSLFVWLAEIHTKR